MGLGSGGFANCGLGATGGRLCLLLGSACVSALLLGSGVPPALAACAINDVGNSLGAGPFNNTTNSINCINIQNSTVNGGTGKVSNTSPGVITTTSPASQTGIKINNSTLTGAVINAGTITATVGSGNGIVVVSGASVAGGITNSGTITAKFNGIEDGVEGFTLTFSAGISNSGKIAATSSFLGAGISSAGVSTFTGGISNSGTITAQLGVTLANVSTFSGGIFNSGTIAASALSLGLPIGISVDGTGHIAGAAPATFAGGITNIGVVAGGIGVEDFATFTGGISNQSTITSTANGIVVTSISAFTGAVANSGAISVGNVGIFVGLTNFASNGVSTFAGTIANSGAITAKTGISIVDGTIQGQIVDTGNVLATGHGILIDAASRITSTGTAVTITAPTFTGGVSNAGAISTSGASGIGVGLTTTFTGGVVNSGAIQARTHAITVAAVSTFAGGISNSGSLAAINAVLLVSNVAVFGTNATGGITNSGTITGHTAEGIHVLGVATFNGGISNSGLIAPRTGISVSGITTFAGGIANAGTITALVDGIVVGSGVTFAAGSAIVNSGTITGGVAAIDVSLATSPVTINQTAGSIGGAIKLSTNADVLNVSGGTINGNIVGAGTRDTINFNLGAGNTFTYASNFTGVNQVNINSGTLILNGANSATNVTVAGGVLAGTGTIDPVAVTIQNGGTFSPGTPGSPGTSMSIVGTVTFQPGATYQVYLNPSAATSATVSGAVSLAGTVQANFAPGIYVSRSYDILHSGGLGGTTFSGVTTVPSNFNATLNYTSTDVLLNLTAGLGQATGLTVNQHDVATAINTFFNNGGALPPRFATVFGLSGGTLAGALNQLDGEAATGAQRAAFQIESEFLSLLLDPFVDGRGDAFAGAHGGMLGFAHDEQASLPASVALAYASVLKAPPRPPGRSAVDRLGLRLWRPSVGERRPRRHGLDQCDDRHLRFRRRDGLSALARHRGGLRARRRRHRLGPRARNGRRPQRYAAGRCLRRNPSRAGLRGRGGRLRRELDEHQPQRPRRCAHRRLRRPERRRPARDRLPLSADAADDGARHRTLCGGADAMVPHAGLQRARPDAGWLRAHLPGDDRQRHAQRARLARRRSRRVQRHAALAARPARLGPRLGRQPGALRGVPDAARRQLRRVRRPGRAQHRAGRRRRRIAHHAEAHPDRQIRRRIRHRRADLCRVGDASLQMVKRAARCP